MFEKIGVRIKVMKENERNEVSEQIKDIGKRTEDAIVEGEPVFLGEVERVWIGGMVERNGIDITKIEGPTNLSQQVDGLIGAMGLDRTKQMVSGLISKMLESRETESVSKFVDELFSKSKDGEVRFSTEEYQGWKKKAVQRMEAIVASANKLLWIIGAGDAEEATRRQGTEGIKKHLRERVLRGKELEGQKIDPSIPRWKAKDPKQNKLRVLHSGEMAMILETLVGM
ncbi:TPA: hypothetical protein DIU27_03925 [Candidatus Collierbacteria bacterium]|uniref:Uncharacterized protein n=1 Tax=Candidatus Collierbacteria bacterium GW2011_GWB2_44_22 TaxID=1618387 RepID=A0A0G1K4B6_9BACT|nr:MAG: hypothetical protein UW31_C0003G0070 [Candidatus Collierbacteria bacterium GW2011_GWA2_44_13]KKT51097.1 MAG: hypothetical protein UW44_C0016G0008 [Candidatus Collierbacteria bacterium GW2011_GWB2_44_22]KKT61973.1 MAG: hypothetical protein UW56_C0014G0018 [Candidatus Collierbacteria bacterium GW2011_GWD1_44_27]KKT65596.1 MAG: hypothetical protein UW58_C0025G0010 [Candidatus Collierbacteria bacterium GW2011_GWC2_44_30]KKT68178.1 MAG: hypothetical protein UW64_C0027G0008 [Microgenomates gr